MILTRKEFITRASSVNPGDHLRIKAATGWEYLRGWDGHDWYDVAFVSFNGKEAVFQCRLYKHRRFYVTYRDVMSGRYMIIWDKNEVFIVNHPNDLKKNNVLKMWDPGKLKHY